MLRVFNRVPCIFKSVRSYSPAISKQDGPLFPPKDDFPSRHIGPRERDIVSMLDTLGFKV